MLSPVLSSACPGIPFAVGAGTYLRAFNLLLLPSYAQKAMRLYLRKTLTIRVWHPRMSYSFPSLSISLFRSKIN